MPAGTPASRKLSGVNGVRLLELMLERREGVTLADASSALELDSAQLHRLLRGLVGIGYATQNPTNGRYEPTSKILRLVGRYLQGSEPAVLGRPLLADLAEQSGETVHLGRLTGDEVVCVALQMSPAPVSFVTQIGQSWPLAGTGIGRAVNAFRSVAVVGNAEERRELNLTRRRGYAVDVGTYYAEASCIAAPFFDWTDSAIGAIALSGPTYRFSKARIAQCGKIVVDAANSLSARLGADRNIFGATGITRKVASLPQDLDRDA